MWAIYRKELSGFFSTLTGYVAGGVFLGLLGLLMWVLPGPFNVLDTGQASLGTLFAVAPWVFLFLVPAVTMRLFSDERREGTLELLLSRPVRLMRLVLGKYFAALTLVVLLLVPTLVFLVSVYRLGAPVGSIDLGATWASYLGLLFLGAVYTAIGLWCSAITSNPIVAFVLAAVCSLAAYIGFEQISGLGLFAGFRHVVAGLGIDEHYRAIQRGVIDTRDLVYFVSMVVFFLFATRFSLRRGR